MGLKKCGECGGAISTTAKTCPHCGAKATGGGLGCLGCAGVVVLLFFILNILSSRNGSSPSPAPPSPQQPPHTLTQGQLDLIAKMEREGYLLVEPQLNRAYVSPEIWAGMDAKLKEDFSASLAVYCGNKKGTNVYWVEVYDKMSAKQLAKYSQSWGFTVY